MNPKLPRIDLHRHLEGSVRLQTILELAEKHGVPLPAANAEGLRAHVQIVESHPSLVSVLARFELITRVLGDLEACRRMALEVVLDGASEGLDYLELRFSPLFMALPHTLDPAGVVEAVVDGVRAGARDSGLMVNLIGIMSRTNGPEACMKELEAILTRKDDIVGLDLAGDELGFPPQLFVDHFRRWDTEVGGFTTIHAGEAGPPESIWFAARDLEADRLGHATNAIRDPALLDYLLEQRVGLECNLTSNVQISAVPDYASHPLRRYLEKGLLATINTDNPTLSGVTLERELKIAFDEAGLTRAKLEQAQRNAVEIAFLEPAQKAELLARAAAR